jgi:serine/threonine protein kinase
VRAKKKDTGIVYALKIMDKKFITKENKTAYVKLERIVLDQLDHPGIVRLFFTFQDNYSLCRYLGSSLSKFLCFCSPCFIFFLLQPQWLWLVCLSGFIIWHRSILILLCRHGTWILWRRRTFWSNNQSEYLLKTPCY